MISLCLTLNSMNKRYNYMLFLLEKCKPWLSWTITWANDHDISYWKCNPLSRPIDFCAKFKPVDIKNTGNFSTKLNFLVCAFGIVWLKVVTKTKLKCLESTFGTVWLKVTLTIPILMRNGVTHQTFSHSLLCSNHVQYVLTQQLRAMVVGLIFWFKQTTMCSFKWY